MRERETFTMKLDEKISSISVSKANLTDHRSKKTMTEIIKNLIKDLFSHKVNCQSFVKVKFNFIQSDDDEIQIDDARNEKILLT